MVDWIEAIPFYETRNYVQRVLENAVVYDLMNPRAQRAGSAAELVSRQRTAGLSCVISAQAATRLGLTRSRDDGGAHGPPQLHHARRLCRAARRISSSCSATSGPSWSRSISWAAGNGDRSENGDYIYGRKRLREIDRRLGWLSKRMKAAKVVDPAAQADRAASGSARRVTIADEDDNERILTLVGDDEADAGDGRIGWNAPLARALRGAAVGDVRRVDAARGRARI